MEKSWYSVEEASALLGVSKQTVREKLLTKEIKGNKVGREWRILKSSINNLLGIDNKEDERDIYIKELEEKIKYLTLQIETFKDVAKALVKVIK
ncbi:MAG: helix-turn-helix domain-containing protein [Clostridium sp.]|uniref:helix-turn-helix domain-containing protein n=1 Tax=Clostridium sp. TaxID=1506 RepID=UPI0025C6AC47|nr:helix-turn-helix domain-containing protein [Clostridium sp.]MCF0149658.1 helix-turn-helix domain-containing protein [Clostridium sp.]